MPGHFETTHTKTLPDGRVLDIMRLNEILADKMPIEMPLAEIKGADRSRKTGFSSARYAATDTELPLIVDESRVLLDGRHRLLKLIASGKTSARVIVATETDIRDCLLE